MAEKEVVVKVPAGTKAVKIEFEGRPAQESKGNAKRKICD